MRVPKWIKGIVFCGLWFFSIFSGFLILYCPLLPLLLLKQSWFRRITDLIFATWELYPVALLECVMGMRVFRSGDILNPMERSILIMNHRTRVDWNFLWAGMHHASKPLSHRLKFVLKAPIRHIPGPGWVMQLGCFLYIYRTWSKDQHILASTLDYFNNLNHSCQIVLFPEGTDLTPKSLQRSHEYAESHHLAKYYKVLHPKTTGFSFLAHRMLNNNQLDAIYDLTLGYPDTLPQSELDLVKGNFPNQVHFYIKRYPKSCLPITEAGLKQFLASLWHDKETTLTNFYERGYFEISDSEKRATPSPQDAPEFNTQQSYKTDDAPSPDYSDLRTPPDRQLTFEKELLRRRQQRLSLEEASQPHEHALYLALIFWTSLCLGCFIALMVSQIFQAWAIFHSAIFIALSIFTEGIHRIEIWLYCFKTKLCSFFNL